MTNKARNQYEKELFELCESIGEKIDGPIHIIDTTNKRENEGSFRVYHNAGYCFDITKEDVQEEDGKPLYAYYFFSEWPEFATLDVFNALRLVKETK